MLYILLHILLLMVLIESISFFLWFSLICRLEYKYWSKDMVLCLVLILFLFLVLDDGTWAEKIVRYCVIHSWWDVLSSWKVPNQYLLCLNGFCTCGSVSQFDMMPHYNPRACLNWNFLSAKVWNVLLYSAYVILKSAGDVQYGIPFLDRILIICLNLFTPFDFCHIFMYEMILILIPIWVRYLRFWYYFFVQKTLAVGIFCVLFIVFAPYSSFFC